MSINAHTTRRSVLTGTTAVMFGGQALAETPPRGPFTIEGWKTAWNSPSPERVMARIPLITTPDVTGYWPRTTRPVRGPKEYAQRIVDLLAFIPDFRAELVEHATNGDIMFLRWVATGTERTLRSRRRRSPNRAQWLCGRELDSFRPSNL